MGKKKSEFVLLKISGEIDNLETEYPEESSLQAQEILSYSQAAVSLYEHPGACFTPEQRAPQKHSHHIAAVEPVNIMGDREEKGDRKKRNLDEFMETVKGIIREKGFKYEI